ncbi:MAG: hydroxyacid dehydrogenase, partial [Clostridia bacterium]|nr:hydroxyacid dehydrogenase [Clostridia bacterium]
MKITVLDAATLGADVSMEVFSPFGEVTVYETTSPDEVALHAAGAEVLLLNKVRLNAENLRDCHELRLICVAATGFDNIDLDYCRLRGIAVCNVVGYSTQSVAQLTVAMALSLMTNLPAF